MARIRILAVDDSVVIRKLLADALGADPDLEVVATAANGRLALQKLTQVAPDAVVCDVEMPEMDGIATVTELRRTHPRLPVVMFSSATTEGARVTLDCLHAGANDFVTKPQGVGPLALQSSMEQLRSELGAKIKALCRGPGDLSGAARAVVRAAPPPPPAPAQRPAPVPAQQAPSAPVIPAAPLRRTGRIEAVVVGVSTGGPNALAEVVPRLPRDLGVPVLIVQHMPPVFTKLLAERLGARSQLAVREAAAGDVVQAGTVLIAPGDQHLGVRREGGQVRCFLNRDPPENSVRPAADVLFRTAADVWGGNVLTVVMTGMGQDGLRGVVRLRELGAPVLIQDEATSVVWGMPGAVAKARLHDRMLPLAQLADAIASGVRGR